MSWSFHGLQVFPCVLALLVSPPDIARAGETAGGAPAEISAR